MKVSEKEPINFAVFLQRNNPKLHLGNQTAHSLLLVDTLGLDCETPSEYPKITF